MEIHTHLVHTLHSFISIYGQSISIVFATDFMCKCAYKYLWAFYIQIQHSNVCRKMMNNENVIVQAKGMFTRGIQDKYLSKLNNSHIFVIELPTFNKEM